MITAPGALPAQLIINVAVRSATENTTGSVVRQGFVNALRRASEWGATSIAVAPLGTGAGNLDAETAADIMLAVTVRAARLETVLVGVTVRAGLPVVVPRPRNGRGRA